MATFAGGKIEAYVGPPELGAADDLETVIVDFIGGARSSLDIAVQEIDSRAIAQAILDARWRGVRVDIFLEQADRRTIPGRSANGSRLTRRFVGAMERTHDVRHRNGGQADGGRHLGSDEDVHPPGR